MNQRTAEPVFMNYLLWQLLDSGFPSGGFAHSGGLEASVQHGHVQDPDSVYRFARQSLAQNGRGALPLVTAAHRRPDDLPALDVRSDVFLLNPVAYRASQAQGRALLTAAVRAFPVPAVTAVDETVRGHKLAGHHAPLYGAIFHAMGVSLADTQRAFLFTAIRGVVSAAVRLGLLGAYDAQEIHAAVAGGIDETIGQCDGVAPDDIAHTAPLIDLYQSTHDRLYSKLFQS